MGGLRRWLDRAGLGLAWVCLGLVLMLALSLALVLWTHARPAAEASNLLGMVWAPSRGHFGLLPFLVGSLAVTSLAMLLAGPLCLMTAAYLSEYAGRHFREAISPCFEVLAAVPSVVFGLFGVALVVPMVAGLGRLLGKAATGFSILSGGLVLAMMVMPFVITFSLHAMQAVSLEAREAGAALGATRWEIWWAVVFREALPGLVAAQMLGYARAFGETMAVVMVVGNVTRVPHSLWDPACPIPALLANQFGEMLSVPSYESALMRAALLLLAVECAFSLAVRATLRQLRNRGALG